MHNFINSFTASAGKILQSPLQQQKNKQICSVIEWSAGKISSHITSPVIDGDTTA